jgi:pyruvate dehydrogenase (quinone)
MAKTVGQFVLERLQAWGVRRVYGYPGDGINGVIAGFHEVEALEFVQARHEEMAAFMACAHAKFTGEVGVCMATSGPGAIHLLNGLYDAKMDRQPVVAIVGQQDRAALGGDYQQEVDLISLFKDVAHEYVHMASSPVQVRHLIDRAIRIAQAERTVTCVILPKDVQELDAVTEPPHEHGTIHTSVDGTGRYRMTPPEAELRRAADILNAGKKVAILIGRGATDASEEVIRTAELLGAGVAKALLGKAALPDDLPFVTGSIGLLGTKPSWDLMQDCDTFLMIGSSFPYPEFLPAEGQARGVQIEIDPRLGALRYPMDCVLLGDAAETLRLLIPFLQHKADRKWREQVEDNVRQWWKVLEARAMKPARPLNPQRVFWELSPRLPDGVIITADSGSSTNWFARDLKMRTGMMASLSGNLATMGCGLPYAFAAKMAYPERPVLAVVGDGAMQMNGNGELVTVARQWKKWKDPRFVVLVLNNQDLNQVTWELRAMSGDPKLPASQNLPDFPYAGYAELLGLRGIKVDHPNGVAPAWEAAFRADRPVVIEAVTDPEVPPLPPHITFKQAKAMASALLKGDPAAAHIIRQTYRDMSAGWMAQLRA